MKKIFGITMFIIAVLVSFVGITYSYEYNQGDSLLFELNGPYKIYLNLHDKYEEYGVKVIKNGVNVSSQVNIDNSLLDVNKVGDYKVKYNLLVDGNIEYIYRMVYVRENIKPVIKLKGEEVVYLKLYGTYIEDGYEVTDNYDIDLYKKVVTTSNLVVNKVGEYMIKYTVVDSSGNESVAIRKVVVQ